MVVSCPKCGQGRQGDAAFCGKCGYDFRTETGGGSSSVDAGLSKMSPAPDAPAGAKGVEYMGFWIRVVATIIDFFVLAIPSYILSVTLPVGLYYVLSIALGFLYSAYMNSSKYQATVGKIVLGMKIVDESGNKLTFSKAAVRYFSTILSAIIIGIGFLMVGWDKKKQGLHDKIAKTYVVRK